MTFITMLRFVQIFWANATYTVTTFKFQNTREDLGPPWWYCPLFRFANTNQGLYHDKGQQIFFKSPCQTKLRTLQFDFFKNYQFSAYKTDGHKIEGWETAQFFSLFEIPGSQMIYSKKSRCLATTQFVKGHNFKKLTTILILI